MNRERFNVFGVEMDAVNLPTAVSAVVSAATSAGRKYVCLTGAHGIIEARRCSRIARALRDAYLVLPDGMPTVWIAWWKQLLHVDRVFGADLMMRVIDSSQASGARHFLYGGIPGVTDELALRIRALYPKASVVGTYTPPFRPLTSCEERELIAHVQAARPDFFWVGIGTPKQEIFMREYLNRLPVPVMIGVGAAFDFHTARLKDSPAWVKRSGLQWLHRLAQDPRRLWWRYLRTNSLFLFHTAMLLLQLRQYLVLLQGGSPNQFPISRGSGQVAAD